MIEELRTWIISICTAVIFITAVEMVMPNNSFKKYTKFVLGLILITVLINPIIKLFDRNFNIDDYANKAVQYFDQKGYEQNFEKYKENSMTNTLNIFKLNLENQCEKKLKEKFPKNNYKVDAAVGYDESNNSVFIKNLKIGLQDGKVEKVKKVEVSTKSDLENSVQVLNDEKSRLLKDYLSKELGVSSDVIEVYKQ
ncbi:stage III sporulation protein AF [Clostridium sp. SYSU_GA19001]|uniref:stage III sporulation protein AF n=1 Tax=Clostridium caldaquaticum TaxID=2940653 RepID=UPI0020771596|nr:stage III sporulation protein AF [Clostridium caldaquaticum]MCM8711041.1 stage III sporulation protein AF [Clostridium caldaquaticum]